MSPIILKDDLAECIRQQAQQRGYATPEAYLLDLVEADTDTLEYVMPEASQTEIEESFKRAFKDALSGRVLTREELRRRLAEDV